MDTSDGTYIALARLHKALGDETRLRIVHLLAHTSELCVCDIETILKVSQSRASRHLNHLKQADVVLDRRDGTWVYYRLSPVAWPALRSAIREIKKALAGDPQAECDLVRARSDARMPSCALVQVPKRG